MLIVRSPVRISLAGGGTDLPAYYRQHGGAVLNAAINKYFYCVLCGRKDGRVQIISSDLRVTETWSGIVGLDRKDSRLEIPLAVLQHLGQPAALDLFLASEILPGTGLGSSAAVCVNLLAAVSKHFGRTLSKAALAEEAYHIARNVLHKPVGKQDEFASAYGGVNLFEFHADERTSAHPIAVSSALLAELESRLLLFFTGASHDSWTILKTQEQSSAAKAGPALEALHAIKAMAQRMRHVLESGELDSVGLLLHEGWEAKKQLSREISNSRIDGFYELARRAGALGGKITGAGGGGFLLLYVPPECQDPVRMALGAEGLQEMSFGFDHSGAHVVADDPFLDGSRQSGLRWNFVPVGEHPNLVSS